MRACQWSEDENWEWTTNPVIIEKNVEDENDRMLEYLFNNGYIKDPNFRLNPIVEWNEEQDNDDDDDANDDNEAMEHQSWFDWVFFNSSL